jgi:hypothetical protein
MRRRRRRSVRWRRRRDDEGTMRALSCLCALRSFAVSARIHHQMLSELEALEALERDLPQD